MSRAATAATLLLVLTACEPTPPTTPTRLAEAASRALDDASPEALRALFLRGDALAAACRDPAALASPVDAAEEAIATCLKLKGGGGDAIAAGGAELGPKPGCGAEVAALGELVAILDGGGKGVLLTVTAPLRVGDRHYLGGEVRCVEVPEGARAAFAAMLRIHDARASSGAATGDLLTALREFGARWQTATPRERMALDRSLGCMRAAKRQDDLDNCTAPLKGPPPMPLGCSRYLEFMHACRFELPEAVRPAVEALEGRTRRSWDQITDDGALARLCAEELAAAVRDVKACPKSTAAAFEAPTRPVGEAPIPAGAVRPTAELVAATRRAPEEELAAAREALADFARGPGQRSPEELTSALETVAAADPTTPVVDTLLRYAYLRQADGSEFLHAVRHALAKQPDPAIAERLAAIARGEDADVAAFAARHGVEAWELTVGKTTLRLLLDRLEPATLPVFLEQLELPLTQPPGLRGKRFDAWRYAQVERLKLAMFGAGHLGTDADLARLGAIVKDPARDKTNQRLNAAAAVAMIGSVAAQDLLLDLYAAERDESFRASLLQLVALSLDDRRLARFDAVVRPEDPAARHSPEVTHALTKNDALRIFVRVVRECEDDRGCYLQKLRNVRQDDQLKALAVLGRGRFGDDAELRAAILKALDNAPISKTDVRRFGVLALARIGAPEDGLALVRLGASLDEEEGFWRDELLQLGTAISRRPPKKAATR